MFYQEIEMQTVFHIYFFMQLKMSDPVVIHDYKQTLCCIEIWFGLRGLKF